METKTCTCVTCPVGCTLEATFDDAGALVEVTGNRCERGHAYALSEFTCPMRMLTVAVNVPGAAEPLSVKTAEPVPKAQLPEIIAAVNAMGASVTLPVRVGDVICPDVCGTGVAILATKSLSFRLP